MAVDPVSAGIDIAGSIANTISGISDATKRRNAEIGLNYLTAQQQADLNERLAQTQDQNERLQILSNAIIQYSIANQTAAQKSKTTMLLAAAGLSVALMVMAIFLFKKSNK